MLDNWKVRWETVANGFQQREVFTDPTGEEWLRAGSPETALCYVVPRTRGLQPVGLRPRRRRDLAGLGIVQLESAPSAPASLPAPAVSGEGDI